MNQTLQDLMRDATRLTQAGRLNEATAAIQRALGGSPPRAAEPHPGPRRAPAAPADVIDGCVFEVVESGAGAACTAPAVSAPGTAPGPTPGTTPDVAAQPAPRAAAANADGGAFTAGAHLHGSMTRDYKLYTPPNAAGGSLPLVVMLHGCTQDPDDFAAGTGMNERAREQGFFVLYPAQSQAANPQRCWNWFKHNHQRRGSGEPALLASMTQAVIEQHGIDPRRVYVAGLSAGGAMAAVVACAYPEIFAAAGVHSGLPAGAATNVSEALAVMGSGVAGPGRRNGPGRGGAGRGIGGVGLGLSALRRAGTCAPASVQQPDPVSAPMQARTPNQVLVPTIVFHGDQDHTVHPRNGEQVIAAALGAAPASGQAQAASAADPTVEQGASSRGRRYTRATHRGPDGKVLAEHWLVHGAGHAWSGGHAEGSYTDATGPDATREMLRFFGLGA